MNPAPACPCYKTALRHEPTFTVALVASDGPGRMPVHASWFSAVVLLGAWITASGGLLHWQWRENYCRRAAPDRNTAQAFKEHTLRIIATADQSMLRIQEGVRDGWLDGPAIERITRETGMEHKHPHSAFLGWAGRSLG